MNEKDYAEFQKANREAQLLDTLLRVPGYAEKLSARMNAQQASEKPIRELAVGEKAYTANWAFCLSYSCYTWLSLAAEHHTMSHIQRTGYGFVFLDGDRKGEKVKGE